METLQLKPALFNQLFRKKINLASANSERLADSRWTMSGLLFNKRSAVS